MRLLDFLQEHRYFASSARTLRQELKKRHIEEAAALLEECQSTPSKTREGY